MYFTPGGQLIVADVVDRRPQYQAKVLNAGLNKTIDFRSRYARGLAFKARTGLLCPGGVDNALARVVSALDWTPATPRPDAPPRKPGSAAA
jgi:hypothetical protein